MYAYLTGVETINEDKLDKFIKKYPLFANAVVPTLVVGIAMLTMATVMSLINYLI